MGAIHGILTKAFLGDFGEGELSVDVPLPPLEAAALLREACETPGLAPEGFVEGTSFEIMTGDLWAPVFSGELRYGAEGSRLVGRFGRSRMVRQFTAIVRGSLIFFACLGLAYISLTAEPAHRMEAFVSLGLIGSLVIGLFEGVDALVARLDERSSDPLSVRRLLWRIYGLDLLER